MCTSVININSTWQKFTPVLWNKTLWKSMYYTVNAIKCNAVSAVNTTFYDFLQIMKSPTFFMLRLWHLFQLLYSFHYHHVKYIMFNMKPSFYTKYGIPHVKPLLLYRGLHQYIYLSHQRHQGLNGLTIKITLLMNELKS